MCKARSHQLVGLVYPSTPGKEPFIPIRKEATSVLGDNAPKLGQPFPFFVYSICMKIIMCMCLLRLIVPTNETSYLYFLTLNNL